MTTEKIRAPLSLILSGFIPLFLEEAVPGYEATALIAGENRISKEQLRAVLFTAMFIGTLNHCAESGFDFKRTKDALRNSVSNISGITDQEVAETLHLVDKFIGYNIIRANHSLDDWLCEALWSEYQSNPYDYPSALSQVIAYGLTIGDSLKKCAVEN
jgi:hypothetical protein